MYPRLKPLAALLPLSFVLPALAVEQLAALDTMMVTATRQQMRTSELVSDVTVIERDDIERSATANIGELLARQPGIEFSQSGSYGATASVFMRGSSAGHTLVLVDGMRVGSATLGQMSSWAQMPLSQVERVEILRGPASSLYGSDAIGGVIHILTRQGDGTFRPNLEIAGGSYGTLSASGGVSGSVGSLRYALNVAGFRSDGFNSLRNPANFAYNPDRDGFDNHTVNGGLAYALSKGHEIGANFFYSDGESRYDSSWPAASSADYRNRQALSSFSTYMKNRLSDQWTSTLRLGRSTDDSMGLADGVRTDLFRTDQEQYSWQNDIRSAFGTFMLGVERLNQRVRGTGNFSVAERTIDSALAGWTASYQAHRLQTNLRYDDNTQFGGKTTGSIAYGYRLSSNWRTNIGYGTGFKAPSFNDLYYPLTWGYQGNPNLKPESSRNREASLHYETGSQQVSLTWFLNRVDNLISWSGVTTPGNIGTARIEGVTAAYEGQVGAFTLAANYNYQDPRDVATGRQLARRATNFGMASVGQTLGNWEWRVELQATDRRFDTDANTTKLGGYALTNLYAAYRIERNWSLFARVNNIFDRDYQLVSDFATPGLNAFAGIRYSPR